ncbi:MBL fold metallo-hydrolase [Clostridium sp. SHJSY1]|uniref:MBL fold metallo-hydrolase n=1 Tax=Clostridium sp. SHJSY1 TaxID=2942483 RepID=UPI002876810F|nr:MBL fold metallo-hydrolase [Clostridium sp. SHJSY1]MDS0525190.1 MBL fold metallo-hydrolase [Clostridium sp. SHJSY1]
MKDWFTIEKIDNKTYAISEYKHWEETHCYLLLGSNKCLLIDTGLGVANIRKAVERITSLPIQVVTTHVHWDHIGGHKHFENIGVFATEKEWLSTKFPIPLNVVKTNLAKAPCKFPKDFNINDYELFQGEPSLILYNDDYIELGNRNIQVIHTPGHSPGHICLYEEEKGYLYSGDLIYEGTLDAFYPTTNPYDFMLSVKKTKDLKVNKILPAHHNLNISSTLINDIYKGFIQIYDKGQLKQGSGIFTFNNFNIHI